MAIRPSGQGTSDKKCFAFTAHCTLQKEKLYMQIYLEQTSESFALPKALKKWIWDEEAAGSVLWKSAEFITNSFEWVFVEPVPKLKLSDFLNKMGTSFQKDWVLKLQFQVEHNNTKIQAEMTVKNVWEITLGKNIGPYKFRKMQNANMEHTSYPHTRLVHTLTHTFSIFCSKPSMKHTFSFVYFYSFSSLLSSSSPSLCHSAPLSPAPWLEVTGITGGWLSQWNYPDFLLHLEPWGGQLLPPRSSRPLRL